MEEAKGFIGDDKPLLFELLSLILNHWLSRGLFYEELDDCWRTEDSWGGLITKLFNGGVTDITSDDKLLIFQWLYVQLKHRLSRGVVHCLPWLLPVPLLWRLPIPFGRGMMNAIWVCGGVVCLLFCLLMAIKKWEPNFWYDNCSHVWFSVPGLNWLRAFCLNIILIRL